MKRINKDKLLVVDLYSGTYIENNIGHETLNFTRNLLDNNYYGYTPPWSGITIVNFGAKNGDEYIDGVTVIYVQKKEGCSDREIIGFCLNTRTFKKPQFGKGLNRFIEKDGKIESVSYTIISDNLFDLRNDQNKFEIKIKNYNSYMFRSQRFYGGTYPNLDAKIISYLEAYLESEVLDYDGSLEQEAIQISDPADASEITGSASKALQIVSGSQGKKINKNSRISKAVLVCSKYTCGIDPSHTTFLTKYKVFYMEGHHLIPCTVDNSQYFLKKFNLNIDCFENIVCICPNCHRAIHYGEWEHKSELITKLYNQQKTKLESIGLSITLQELLDLYKGNND